MNKLFRQQNKSRTIRNCSLKCLVTFTTTKLRPDIDKLAEVKQRQRLDNDGNKLLFFRFIFVLMCTYKLSRNSLIYGTQILSSSKSQTIRCHVEPLDSDQHIQICKINVNIILPYLRIPTKWPLALRFPDQCFARISHFYQACCMSYQFHPKIMR